MSNSADLGQHGVAIVAGRPSVYTRSTTEQVALEHTFWNEGALPGFAGGAAAGPSSDISTTSYSSPP